MQNNWRTQLDAENHKGNFYFGYYTPSLVYNLEKDELSQVFTRQHELKNHFGSVETIEILLWLGHGITDSEFEYLCAYLIEREFGYITDIQEGFQGGGIDVSEIKGTKKSLEYIAMQWNAWKINMRGISEIYEKMADVKYIHNSQVFLATINDLESGAWDFVNDNMETWDYPSIIDYYKKYFFDPNTGWEEFQYFVSKKIREKEIILNKKNELKETLKETKEKTIIHTRMDTVKLLYALLKEVRTQEAIKHKISPNYIFSNKVLLEMATRRPISRIEFLKISGVGALKYEKYCSPFQKAIKDFKI